MPFRLREDAERWFSEIANVPPIKTKFDLYYFCLLAGLVSGRSSDPTKGVSAPEFVNNFVEEYKPSQRLLTGLLIIAELKRGGIDIHEKAAVRDTIRRLVDPQSPTGLTDEGMRRLNAYASGGYDYLAEERDTKPYSPEEFLRDYARLMGHAADELGLAA